MSNDYYISCFAHFYSGKFYLKWYTHVNATAKQMNTKQTFENHVQSCQVHFASIADDIKLDYSVGTKKFGANMENNIGMVDEPILTFQNNIPIEYTF